MTGDWLVSDDRNDTARVRLYTLATEMIGRDGLDRFDLNDLARRAHCSRATVYRHVGGKKQLLEAVWAFSSAAVVAEVEAATAGVAGRERTSVAITVAVQAIRSDRVIRQFVESRQILAAADTVIHSPTIIAAASELMGLDPGGDPGNAVTVRFAIRAILSILTVPAHDPAEERELIDILVHAVHPS
ncbi:helix-turn-helix domain-containing protein [Gordonia sp. PKS22-38]|uniref:Helix-turn-helix domain-containing protein n=1 Tax=Gordonia prachuapensis TaxID=3115651 RepID=A0ABU7MYP9_9ACTN|nr:helix-turn-helix domain-containing protein [Gordonia sp. PKS22-38]